MHHLCFCLFIGATIARAIQKNALNYPQSSCTNPVPSVPDSASFWYEKIEHNGRAPFITNGASYEVFRNVINSPYSVDSTGTNDAAQGIQNALNDGSSSGIARSSGNSTTGQPAVVYLPAGTYILNSPLQIFVNTVLMGNPLSPPTIKASSVFSGNTLIYGKDPNQGSTTNFYISIKNVILDSTLVEKDEDFVLLDWSVSQATQLTNVVFNMPDYSTGHTGIAMPEGGSGTMMGDLVFNGGAVGLNMNNQQYEGKSMTFNGCSTAILVNHCFDCVFSNLTFLNGNVGIDLTLSNDTIGSIALLDSTANNIATVVKTESETTADRTVIIGNFQAGSGVGNVVLADGNTLLNANMSDTWVYTASVINTYSTPRSASLLSSNNNYATVRPPTYADYSVDQIQNVKSVAGLPVYGDGVTDDTANLNAIIAAYAGCKVLFFPAGTYIVSNTLFFPTGSRVYGETWSAISAIGSTFWDPLFPVPMVRVGNEGDVGVAQFSEMLFTVADVLRGCILLEVNIAGNEPGDVGFWNTHFRVGGALGSKVTTNCHYGPESCKAAFMLAHLTSTSSAYIENMWGWTADHDLDGNNTQTISTGRGILIESTRPTWLHGTAFEHNTLYQYNIHNAANLFIGMQQSETPYWQGPGSTALAPLPWTPLQSYGDPTFVYCNGDALCAMALFMQILNSSELFIHGSGFWTFFNNGLSECQSTGGCQQVAADVSGASGLYWFGLNTHALQTIVRNDGVDVLPQGSNVGGWGGTVGAFMSDA